MVLEKSYK